MDYEACRVLILSVIPYAPCTSLAGICADRLGFSFGMVMFAYDVLSHEYLR